MTNPWTKKNPWMSLWLSAANTAAGGAKGRAVSAAKKQASTAQTQAMRSVLDFWLPAPPKARGKKRTRR